MKLIYVSHGNIPSIWAHCLQAMKMGQAFSKIVPKFELLTQESLSTLMRRDKSYIYDQYGIAVHQAVQHCRGLVTDLVAVQVNASQCRVRGECVFKRGIWGENREKEGIRLGWLKNRFEKFRAIRENRPLPIF